jgi:hypothetical protein
MKETAIRRAAMRGAAARKKKTARKKSGEYFYHCHSVFNQFEHAQIVE